MNFLQKLAKQWQRWFISPQQNAVTMDDIARGYERERSITDYLPWRDYNDKHKLFLLEDQKSVAACFKLVPIACEARPAEMLQEIAKSIAEAIKNAVPQEKQNPWILQFFVERQSDLSSNYQAVENYIAPDLRGSSLTQDHLKTLKEHFAYVSRPGGIYFDSQVTNQIFRGGTLHVYAVIYRRHRDSKEKLTRRQGIEEIVRLSRKLSDQWRACGIKVKRMTGEDFYRWMVRWFNPKPRQTHGDINKLLQEVIFPKEKERVYGWDLTENLFFNTPVSTEDGWLFDGLPHKVMTVQSLTTKPTIGHLTAERQRATDDKVFNLIDHLPENSVFSLSVVMQATSETELHLKIVGDSAIGRHAQAEKIKTEVHVANEAIAHGDLLLPTVMAVYLRGENFEDLHEKEAHTEVLLNSNGFKVITEDELYPIDAYLRYLPMCYDYHFDKKNNYRSRFVLLSEIAKIVPVYGRSRGTEHPGFIAFNRGGEPWFYDILKDKTKNAHCLFLGETGTGKSNLLNFLSAHMLALYKPRLFIIEAGGSFDLLADYCAAHKLSVNRVKIDPKQPLSLNPFAHGLKVLEQVEAMDKAAQKRFLETESDKLQEELEGQPASEDDNEDEGRDILGEMVLAAIMMITGGEHKEEERITRADRMLIMDAIIEAARRIKANRGTQMIAADIVDAFEVLGKERLYKDRDSDKIKRASEMADGMRYFTKDIISSQFFNAPGEPWAMADVTIVDFGLFAREGYEAQRAIAFAGCISKILTLAEANQFSKRPIIAIFDENHLFSREKSSAAMQTRIAKMGRKLGLWIWVATQNLRDFVDEAHKMLSLLETWVSLAVPPDEIDQIKRFKTLTPEQEALFLSAQKEKGKYTEGVLLSPRLQGLFRSVPPRRYLVMAATDQDEKYQRKQLMRERNCTELEVVDYLAQQMMQAPLEVAYED